MVYNINYWSNNYATKSKFPLEFKNVAQINPQFCDLKTLRSKLKQLEKYNDRKYTNLYPFLDYFFRLQANICWQSLEERRWSAIGKELDKSKWIGFYDVISVLRDEVVEGKNDRINKIGKRVSPIVHKDINERATDIAAKFARHLKRYVPGIESKNFASISDHKSKILSGINDIMRNVCPFFDTVSDEKNLLEALATSKGGEITSLSQQLCKFAPTRLEFIDIVYKYFMDNLDKIETIEKEVTSLEEIEEMLRGSSSDANQFRVRAKNPMDLYEKLYELSKDTSAKVSQNDFMTRRMLYNLREFSSNQNTCLRPYLKSSLGFEKNQATIPESPLSSYIKSLNALRFERCHATMARIAAEASVKFDSYQLARLNEIRQRMIKAQSGNKGLLSSKLVISGFFGTGVAQYIFDYLNRDDMIETYRASIPDKKNRKLKPTKQPKQEKQSPTITDEFLGLMRQVCSSIVDTMSVSLDIYEALEDMNLLKLEQLGETTRMLIDYGNICHHYELIKSDAGVVRDEFIRLASSVVQDY